MFSFVILAFSARVLQGGATYGNLTTKAAIAVGKEGFFDVVDITPIQVTLVSILLQNNSFFLQGRFTSSKIKRFPSSTCSPWRCCQRADSP